MLERNGLKTEVKIHQIKPAKLMLFAPVLFPLHVLEEKPGFVKWFNELVTIPERQINEMDFYAANIGAFVITLILAIIGWKFQHKGTALLTLFWLSFLMFANAVSFHILPTLVQGKYAYGTVTATIIYLPFFIWYLRLIVGHYRPRLWTLIGVIFAGSSTMLIHGSLILFKGTRLF